MPIRAVGVKRPQLPIKVSPIPRYANFRDWLGCFFSANLLILYDSYSCSTCGTDRKFWATLWCNIHTLIICTHQTICEHWQSCLRQNIFWIDTSRETLTKRALVNLIIKKYFGDFLCRVFWERKNSLMILTSARGNLTRVFILKFEIFHSTMCWDIDLKFLVRMKLH